MQVKLKVLRGSNAGKEVVIPSSKFYVGRGEDCHMRPKSEAISRHHCAITIQDNQVVVQDFNSKNGTFVNGQRIEGRQRLEAGDQLRFGPLEFEVLIEHQLGGAKRPAVKDVKEVAARTAAAPVDDIDITDWLEEAQDAPSSRLAEPETRQYRLDETDRVTLEEVGIEKPSEEEDEEAAAAAAAAEKKKKKTPGKLPARSLTPTTDSREAAADMLKRFFNRR